MSTGKLCPLSEKLSSEKHDIVHLKKFIIVRIDQNNETKYFYFFTNVSTNCSTAKDVYCTMGKCSTWWLNNDRNGSCHFYKSI